jgi:hypothetical protein
VLRLRSEVQIFAGEHVHGAALKAFNGPTRSLVPELND